MPEQPTGSSLVGRDRELGDLLQGLDDAAAGRGRLFLIAGDPGIGKTRLADEFARRARERGMRVLWGRGWEGGGAPAYWLWVQVLRSYLRGTGPADLPERVEINASEIAQILPEIQTLFPDLAPSPASDPESARFRLFDAATGFLVSAARPNGLLVILDDMHAADTASILLLRFLTSQLGDSRLAVVATYRDVALTPDHPLAQALPELAREPITRWLVLKGLPEAAAGEFVEATTGRRLRGDLATALWHETGGNPLFLGEALRLLSAEGRLDGSVDRHLLQLTVPAGVREVITRRLRKLDEQVVRALTLGSVLGPEFGLETLRRVGGHEADELLDILTQALEAGLLVPATAVPGSYRFSHDLVREALYDGLTAAERVRLHRQVGEALEAYYQARQDLHLAELAHHFFEAARPGGGAKAVDYARRAADEAARSLAYEEAARLYAMALEALEPDAVEADTARGELLLALGDVQARAGDLEGAKATLLRASKLARRTGAAMQLARAAHGYGGRFTWSRPGSDRHLVPLLQDALVMLGGDDDHMRVRLLARLSCALRSSPEREHSDALSAQALEMARRLGDAPTLMYALEGRFGAVWWPENPDERLALAWEAIDLAAATGNAEREVVARMGAFCTLAELGRMREARQQAEILARGVPSLRQPAHRWLATAIDTELALLSGRFEEAEPYILEGLSSESHPTLTADDVSAATGQLFLLRREQGRLAEAESAVRSAANDFPWYPLHRAALALLLAELGRPAEAREVLDELSRDEFAALYRDQEWLLGMAWASEAAHMLGVPEYAETLYGQFGPFAGRNAVGHPEGSAGAVDRYLGLLAWTLERPIDAKAHLLEAYRMNRDMDARPWAARTEYDLGRLLLAGGEEAEAQRHLASALAVARELGMSGLESQISTLRVEAGAGEAEPPSQDRRAGTFRREGEYWTIVFEGRAFRLRDAKGLRYLARLVARPGEELHSLDLARGEAAGADREQRADGLPVRSDALGDAGPALDAEAKAAYRARLDELQADIAAADAANDPERASRARHELEFLTEELARAVGLGGRDRKAASASERARMSVTRAIRSSIDRIGEHSPALQRHLTATVRTGTYCSYVPDPRLPTAWDLGSPAATAAAPPRAAARSSARDTERPR